MPCPVCPACPVCLAQLVQVCPAHLECLALRLHLAHPAHPACPLHPVCLPPLVCLPPPVCPAPPVCLPPLVCLLLPALRRIRRSKAKRIMKRRAAPSQCSVAFFRLPAQDRRDAKERHAMTESMRLAGAYNSHLGCPVQAGDGDASNSECGKSQAFSAWMGEKPAWTVLRA